MGRPKISEECKRVSTSVRLCQEVLDWLNHQKESNGKLIDQAVRGQYMGQKLEDVEELIPALDEAEFYLAVIQEKHGGGLAIFKDGKWRRVYEDELKRLAQKSPKRGL